MPSSKAMQRSALVVTPLADKERVLALFEKHRASPRAPYDAGHFLDFLLPEPVTSRADYNSQLVREGKVLRRQLMGMWHKEHHRKPPLPHKFPDSHTVMAEFAGNGLDVTQTEVTLRAECRARQVGRKSILGNRLGTSQ